MLIPAAQVSRSSGSAEVITQLDNNPVAGATSFLVAEVPLGLVSGALIAIDAYSTQCELRSVSSVSGNTVTVDALKFSHTENDKVVIVSGNVITTNLYGLAADGSDEWGPLQRMLRETTYYGAVAINGGGGTYYAQQPLLIPTGSRIDRLTVQSRTGFAPVDSAGAMVAVGNHDEFFTATAADDTFTSANAHGMAVNDLVAFNAPYGETLPTGVTAGRFYYVKTAPTGTTFTVSETLGGATLNLTGDGAGWAVMQIGSLTRVFWESMRINLTVANLNGLNIGLQQPSWTRNLRVEMDANASSTTADGVNATDSATVNVVSTTGFPTSGTFQLENATTKVRTTVSYTGVTATSFTGCGSHAATVGGEVITTGCTGVFLGGQLSYHDNIEINPAVATTGLKINGSGHIVRGFNCNGVNDKDTGVLIADGTRNVDVSDLWTEQCGRAGVEIEGVSRGTNLGGTWLVSSNAPTTAPALLITANTTGYAVNQMRVTSTSQLLINDTSRSIALSAWDGGTAGETDTGLVFHGLRQWYGGVAPIFNNRHAAHTSADLTVGRVATMIRVNASGALRTITVPTAVGWLGWTTTIFNAVGANNVVVDPAGTETVDGASTLTLLPGEAATLYSDGANYQVIGARGSLPGTLQTYSVTNAGTDRAYDANATTLDEIADVLGTLIADLRARKIVA